MIDPEDWPEPTVFGSEKWISHGLMETGQQAPFKAAHGQIRAEVEALAAQEGKDLDWRRAHWVLRVEVPEA